MPLATAPRHSRAPSLVSRLSQVSSAEFALLAEAFVTLAFASAAIRRLSFLQVGRLASRSLGPSRSKQDEGLLDKIAWAVRASARHVPWRAVCFQQGLTAPIMLRRRGVASTLYFGASM